MFNPSGKTCIRTFNHKGKPVFLKHGIMSFIRKRVLKNEIISCSELQIALTIRSIQSK